MHRQRLSLFLVGLAFLASGGAALVYQVVWQRLLAFHTGVGIVSIALIVSAFMAGLGLGSHLGGILSTRLAPRVALWAFSGLEWLIGLMALGSIDLYYRGLGQLAPGVYANAALAFLAHFVALLPPTALMGMSLPFLVRAQVRDAATAPRTIGALYGINVLGASVGALVTPWLLLRFFGMGGAVLFGVAANGLAGLAALVAGLLTKPGEPSREVEVKTRPVDGAGLPRQREDFSLWVGLYALTGFIALSLEIVWFRIVDVAVKSTAFTFGNVLCVYLMGLGLGSLIGSRLARRWSRPLVTFVTLQCALLVYSGAAVTLLARIPVDLPGYAWYLDYWATDYFFQLGADWDLLALLRLYLVLPVLLYGLPTLLMGLSFTALQRAVQDDPRTSGRKVGLLQAANIAGCVAGSLVGGLLLLDRLGVTGTLRVLIGVGGLAMLAVWLRHGGSKRVAAGWATLLLAAFVTLPDGPRLWTRLHGVRTEERPSFIGEDASAVSAITPGQPGFWRVEVGGLPHSFVPYGGLHTMLGALPAVVHPAPRDVVVVGLGSGETAWAAACRRETRSVVVYEIAGGLPGLLPRVAEVAEAPGLWSMLADGRIQVRVADGRHALRRSERRYDFIQVDALFRTSAGSGNLYSVEFFELCARRLSVGGVVCTQIPSRRAALTFSEALPHVLDFGNLMVGSNEPLPIEPEVWIARLRAPEVAGYLGEEAVAGIEERLREARRGHRNPDTQRGLNYDLFPRDEFQTPAGYVW
jgi:spermidine synthase